MDFGREEGEGGWKRIKKKSVKIVMAKKTPIPTIVLKDNEYATAKKDPFFVNYINRWKNKEGVDFLNTMHPYSNIVSKLQHGTPFDPSDISDLEQFRKTIGSDKETHTCNFINNFVQSPSLDLPTLFNKIANSSSYDDFLKSPTITFTSNQKIALPYLFSIIKHFQAPVSYPLNYKQWVHLNEHCKWSTIGNTEYDRLCELYKSIKIPTTDIPRHLYFAAYMDYLAYQLMYFIAPKINNYKKGDLDELLKTFQVEKGNLQAGNAVDANLPPEKLPIPQPQPQPHASQRTPNSFPTHSLNLILYGPPGTGKTYNTLFHALKIIKGDSYVAGKTYEDLKPDYDKLVDSGQIVFTTFHQSMSYEDFIEGIKPIPVSGKDEKDKIIAIHKNENPSSKITQFGDGVTTITDPTRMKYEVKAGVFKKMCDLNAFLKNAKDKKIIFVLDGGGGFIVDKIDGKTIYCKDSKEEKVNIDDLIDELEKRLKQEPKHESEQEQNENQNPNVNPNIDPNHNLPGGENKHTSPYCKAVIDKFLEKKVLIIDEINRGNVAQIFGELITLIEPNKRLGNDEKMTATLQYSQESFGVPNNLYIIGTMNTADRSVEALDTALRRRFDFEEMMPKYDPDLLKTISINNGTNECDLGELLKTINKRIVVLKDREHQIGHSYFMKCKTENDLKKAFKKNIVPLLQEYFYGNYAYIGLVLGNMFVKKDEVANNPKFAELEGFSYDSGDETIYRLLTDKEWENLNLKEAIVKLGDGIVK